MGLKPAQVRHYVRRDLLAPRRGERGEYQFSFQDVVMLRSAKELLDARVSVRRTNRVLLELKQRAEESGQGARPLSSLKVEAVGTRVMIREGLSCWDAESGQGSLPFDDEPAQAAVAEVAALADRSANPTIATVKELGEFTSDDWYNLALDLEESEPERAPEAYRRALELDPQNADAEVNLGRLCQLRGNLKQARRHYQAALDIDSQHELANYNLGTIFDELDQFETALTYYRKAPSIPDAHYNLARLFEVRGNELAALRHMREYRRLLERELQDR